ncbi:anticodon-binding domain-containing protein [Phlyctochytrium arcticum]|nr:anticodon-binding domain-containing protein [Phlyctochytrium arcticum]
MAGAQVKVIEEMVHQGDDNSPPASEIAGGTPDTLALNGLDPANAIGVWVRISTNNNATYEGLVYAFETMMGVMVIQSPSSEAAAGADVAASTTPSPEPAPGSLPAASSPTPTPAAAAGTAKSPAANKPLNFAAAARGTAPPPTTKSQGSSPTPSAGSSSPAPQVASPASSSQTFDFHIIKLSHIKTVEPLARLGEPETEVKEKGKKVNIPRPLPQLVPVGPVLMDKLVARERAAVAKIGLGVTAEAQNIFDYISRTLPTSWRKSSIIVMDEIEIAAPYTIADVRPLPGKNNTGNLLARVKKVLEGLRARLKLEA